MHIEVFDADAYYADDTDCADHYADDTDCAIHGATTGTARSSACERSHARGASSAAEAGVCEAGPASARAPALGASASAEACFTEARSAAARDPALGASAAATARFFEACAAEARASESCIQVGRSEDANISIIDLYIGEDIAQQ